MKELVILSCYSISIPQTRALCKPKTKPLLRHQSTPLPSLYASPSLRPESEAIATSTSTSKSSFTKYYADVAGSLAEAGQLDEFNSITEFVTASGINQATFFSMINLNHVSHGISSNLTLGNYYPVVQTLKTVQGIDPLLFEKLLDENCVDSLKSECLRLTNEFDICQAVPLMEILYGFGFSIKDIVNPSEFISLCVKERNPEMAVRYAALVPNECILVCSIINEFGKKRDLKSALRAYEETMKKSSSPNMYLHRTIIDVCGRCGDFMRSRHIYESILNEKITPNVYVFNSLLNVNARDFRYTLLVYKNMQKLGVAPDMTSFNILLKACALVGRVDMAQDIYKEVKNLEAAGVLKLDVYTYSTVIKALADAKLWQMALKVKEDMAACGVAPNMHTWTSLISACANAGLVEQSYSLLHEMHSAGIKPNEQCCNILIHACVQACQFDRAFRLFETWKGNASVSSPFDIIRSVPFNPSLATYNTLMKACGGNVQRGRDLMAEMRTRGLAPDHITWTCLIEICGNANHVDAALLTLKEMRYAGVEPDVVTYTNAIKVCVDANKLKFAFSLFQEMKVFNLKPNMVTYNTLFKARTRYGSFEEMEQCLSIYEDMLKAGYKGNDMYLKQVIEEWCEGLLEVKGESGRTMEYIGSERLRNLVQRVAVHLRSTVASSLEVDLQGLSPVEGRIVVLAVLKKLKESHTKHHLVKTDMWITLGRTNAAAHADAHARSHVREEVVKLLTKDLGVQMTLPPAHSHWTTIKVSRGSLNVWLGKPHH